jgi:predicted RNA-binding Zn ribbon-like protein
MDHYSFGAVLAADLVNTFDVSGDEELLGTLEALTAFASDHGVNAATINESDLRRLRSARPVLRHAMLADDETTAVAALNDLLSTARPRPHLIATGAGDWRFAYADPEAGLTDRLVAEATAQVLQEIRDHGMQRFSTCASSTCEDVFIDQSRNHSRRYCTPDVCGNREAQRAYRARQTEHAED